MHRYNNRRSPYYESDLDFTTNAPSYYEALARFRKSLKELSKRLNDVEEHFKDLVLGWLEDGTLAGLLEQVLLDDYATEVYVNNAINDLHIEDYATIEWVTNKLNDYTNQINNINNRIDNIETDLQDIFNFKDETTNKLDHFIINVDEFTGSDTEIIQGALNKARDQNGGTVYVPA